MEFDLIVIGAGSGGVRAARMAAQAGKKVAIIEYQALGGTCVNIGCVPKKLFVYASQYSHHFEDAKGFGWQSPLVPFSWKTLIENKNEEISRLNGIYQKLLENAGVQLIHGKARVLDANTVQVDNDEYQANKLLIATGSRPFIPSFPGNDLVDSSEQMFYLEELPKKILIVGGGYIAVEFAGIFNGLGVETHLVYRGDLFLRGFDQDVRERLAKEMRQKGVNIQFNQNVESVERETTQLSVSFCDGKHESFDRVLYATGRVPNTESLGLQALGLDMSKNGAIRVDDNFKSSVSSIYALGDVIDRVQLTPVAIEEAMVFVDQQYGGNTKQMDYSNIPSAVFSQPNFASVGLTEEEAVKVVKAEGAELEVYDSDFRAMKYTLTENPERTYMKLLVNKTTQQVLGVHMMGDDAAEIIQGLAVAVKAGARKADFDATIGIHPSSAEEFVTMRVARK